MRFSILSTAAASFAFVSTTNALSMLHSSRSSRSETAIAVARANPDKYQKRDSCSAVTYNPPAVTHGIPPFDADLAKVYRYRQQQAVNLGNWFVHEAWMGSSTYACATGPKIAEIDIASGSHAKAILEKQWDTFITEEDIKYLSSIGINTVRLPLGYWSLGSNFTKGSIFEEYADVYENSWPRVLRTIGWAGKYGIGVLADLHGAYGSQNGHDHSGVSDGKTNLFTNADDQTKTVNALVWMTQQLVDVTNVVGIQILNEPDYASNLESFYTRAITAMRKVPGAEQFPLYVHDGFRIDKMSTYVGNRDDFVVVDNHSYFVFTDEYKSKSVTEIAAAIKSDVASNIGSNTKTARGNLVIDEWGCALAESSTHVSDLNKETKTYCENQESVYRNQAAGYAFWAYNMDGCKKGDGNGWCFKGSVGNNLPATFFSIEGQTEFSDGAVVTGNGSTNSSSNVSPSTTRPPKKTSSPTTTSVKHSKTGACVAKSKKRSAQDSGSRRRHHSRNAARAAVHHSRASSSGKADGTAHQKQFTAKGMSVIGFVEQYCKDVLGAKCTDAYLTDFTAGVKSGVQVAARK